MNCWGLRTMDPCIYFGIREDAYVSMKHVLQLYATHKKEMS